MQVYIVSHTKQLYVLAWTPLLKITILMKKMILIKNNMNKKAIFMKNGVNEKDINKKQY